jgi:hypothetical protein
MLEMVSRAEQGAGGEKGCCGETEDRERREGKRHEIWPYLCGGPNPIVLDPREGQHELSHRKSRTHVDMIIRSTQSGWTNEEMMLEHLQWLSNQASGEPILLLLDVYAAHRTPKLQQRARDLHIEPLDVPSRGTFEFEPLNPQIFGELKSRARRAFQQRTWRTGDRESTPEHAIEFLSKGGVQSPPTRFKVRERFRPSC